MHPDTSLAIATGSRQVLEMLAESGAISVLLKAGARILEPACGPCIGMGLSPPSGGVSLRTFNRNFKGRSGTYDAKVFLVSPETAAASAIYGKITDPRKLGKAPKLRLQERFKVDDSLIIRPPKESLKVKVIRGPNIKPLP